jgi:hypothetical protein
MIEILQPIGGKVAWIGIWSLGSQPESSPNMIKTHQQKKQDKLDLPCFMDCSHLCSRKDHLAHLSAGVLVPWLLIERFPSLVCLDVQGCAWAVKEVAVATVKLIS